MIGDVSVSVRLGFLFRLLQFATAYDKNSQWWQQLFFLWHSDFTKQMQIIQVCCTKVQTCLLYFDLVKRICKWFWRLLWGCYILSGVLFILLLGWLCYQEQDAFAVISPVFQRFLDLCLFNLSPDLLLRLELYLVILVYFWLSVLYHPINLHDPCDNLVIILKKKKIEVSNIGLTCFWT